MKVPRFLLCAVCGLFLSVGCQHVAVLPEDFPDTVTLSRSPCLGFCPAYDVTIKRDGTVMFVGRSFTEMKGAATKTISNSRLMTLYEKLKTVDFWRINGEEFAAQPDGSIARLIPFDSPSYIITVTQSSRSNKLTGVPGGDYPEGNLAEVIDSVAGIEDWIGSRRR